MAFLPHTVDDGHKQPWEYMAAGDITPKIGLALYLSSGLLEVATGTQKPEYICMQDNVQLTEGDIIPVIRVKSEMVFETTNQADFDSINVGDLVTIHTDGLQVTATKVSGVFEVTEILGEDAGSIIRGRF